MDGPGAAVVEGDAEGDVDAGRGGRRVGEQQRLWTRASAPHGDRSVGEMKWLHFPFPLLLVCFFVCMCAPWRMCLAHALALTPVLSAPRALSVPLCLSLSHTLPLFVSSFLPTTRSSSSPCNVQTCTRPAHGTARAPSAVHLLGRPRRDAALAAGVWEGGGGLQPCRRGWHGRRKHMAVSRSDSDAVLPAASFIPQLTTTLDFRQ